MHRADSDPIGAVHLIHGGLQVDCRHQGSNSEPLDSVNFGINGHFLGGHTRFPFSLSRQSYDPETCGQTHSSEPVQNGVWAACRPVADSKPSSYGVAGGRREGLCGPTQKKKHLGLWVICIISPYSPSLSISPSHLSPPLSQAIFLTLSPSLLSFLALTLPLSLHHTLCPPLPSFPSMSLSGLCSAACVVVVGGLT